MALSPNYSWAEPDNSSLVKNGAQDIRALGDAIDTSVWNIGFGQAGKNAIINGDFNIWQRGAGAFTSGYSSDRWTFYGQGAGTSSSVTRESFATGTAPVAGYEGTFFYRNVITSGSDAATQMVMIQKIEDVRKFAGNTVTMSFWAKANTGAPKIGMEFYQDFGGGGSGAVSGTGQSFTISTSWARYSATFAIPSISGKTVGTGSALYANIWMSAGSAAATRSGTVGIQSATFDIWGVQVEYGSKATPFETATGTLQGELAACQRYYFRSTPGGAYSNYGNGGTISTTGAYINLQFPTQMRISPSVIEYSNIAIQTSGGTLAGLSSLTIDQGSGISASLAAVTASSWTANQPCRMINNANSAGYVGISAEL